MHNLPDYQLFLLLFFNSISASEPFLFLNFIAANLAALEGCSENYEVLMQLLFHYLVLS
jgi:hypothetical protein